MAKVLLVENDLVVLRMMCKILEKEGHSVVCARDGGRGYDALCDNPGVGIIVTDLSMPVMSGQELVAKVRGSEDYSEVPIIMMSAHCTISGVTQLLEEGSTLFLPKPVSRADLIAYVDSLTHPRHAAAS